MSRFTFLFVVLLIRSGAVNCNGVAIHKEGSVLLPRPLIKSQAHGGPGGLPFDDMKQFNTSNIYGIHSICISSSGDTINALEVTYVLSNGSLLRAPTRGGMSDPPVNITLGPKEMVTKVEGSTSGQKVDQLMVTTMGPNYERKVHGPFGKKGNESFTYEGQLIAFHGRSGKSLDNLGVYSLKTMKKSDEFGESIGTEFDDYYDLNYPPIVKIKSIKVWNDVMIEAFQVEYLLLNGSSVFGARHGIQYATNLTTVMFADDEKLTMLEGKIEIDLQTAKKYIGQLTIKTQTETGELKSYGPFGKWGMDPGFSVPGNILSFHGRSGALIYKIGAYYI